MSKAHYIGIILPFLLILPILKCMYIFNIYIPKEYTIFWKCKIENNIEIILYLLIYAQSNLKYCYFFQSNVCSNLNNTCCHY